MTAWGLATAIGAAEATQLAAEGWEPFAVVHPTPSFMEPVFYLRRPYEVETDAAPART